MAMNQRMRSLLSLVVLALVGAGVALYAYYGVHEKEEKEQALKEKKEKLFPDFDKAKVKGLTVTAKGQTTVVEAGEKEQWKVVSPVQAMADKQTVDALVNQLAQLKSKAEVETGAKDLAKYGLDKPAIKIVARVEGSPDLVFTAGAENSFNSTVYVTVGEGSKDVLLAEGNFKWALEKDLFDLRDKRLLPFDDPDVAGFEVTLDGFRYALKKSGQKWELTAPRQGAADETVANRLLGVLRNLRATRFATDTAAAADNVTYGLLSPRVEAVVSLASGARMELAIGEKDEGGAKKAFARRRELPWVAEVADTVFNDLKTTDAELADKTVTEFDKEQVGSVRFHVNNEDVVVEREAAKADGGPGDDWRLTLPAPAPAKKWKVTSVLGTLASLKGTKLVDEKPADLAKYGLDKPTRSVTVLGKDGKELASLLVGSEDGTSVYVKSGASPRVLQLDKARLSDLPTSRADLEEQPAARPDAGQPTPKN